MCLIIISQNFPEMEAKVFQVMVFSLKDLGCFVFVVIVLFLLIELGHVGIKREQLSSFKSRLYGMQEKYHYKECFTVSLFLK